MFSIKVMNAISPKGLSQFPSDIFNLSDCEESPHAILLRSADLHTSSIPDSVAVIGRAGAGTNNIPIDLCTQRGIPVLNTPGANANAVKELVISGLLLSCRPILRGWEYVKQLEGSSREQHLQVEREKKQFVGCELPGRTLAVIGLGAIGVEVANCASYLGMNVIGYDPHMSIKNAWKLRSSVQQAESLREAVSVADFISLHVPLMPATEGFFSAEVFRWLKPDSILLNFARAPLVDETALETALKKDHIKHYVCDFPIPSLNHDERMICLPHLGASTLEAEENCAVMIAHQVKAYLQDGHIQNAVNFPPVKMPRRGLSRIAVVNQNVPNMLAQISTAVSSSGFNIVDMINKSRDQIAYTLIDIDQVCTAALLNQIQSIPGVIRCRQL